MSYSISIVWPIENLGWMLSLVSQGLAGYKKIKKVLEALKPEITDPSEKETWRKAAGKTSRGEISFDNVSFTMDGKNHLEGCVFYH